MPSFNKNSRVVGRLVSGQAWWVGLGQEYEVVPVLVVFGNYKHPFDAMRPAIVTLRHTDERLRRSHRRWGYISPLVETGGSVGDKMSGGVWSFGPCTDSRM